MIQRIQTLYLSLVFFMMGFLIWLPIGSIIVSGKFYSFSVKGIADMINGQIINHPWYFIVILLIILILQVVIIFSYKKRSLQMRITIINIILMLGFMVLAWLFIQSSSKSLGNGVYSYEMAAIFPIVSIILDYLAYRHIRHDEDLIKSVDRIR